jgi:hypothetical protein
MHTQILVECFKNVGNSKKNYFYFDEKLIPLTSDHKHLGITFSEEAKWNKHVENHELETPQLSQTSHAYSNIGRM